MKKNISNREKKRQTSAGVDALRNKPGWNPAAAKDAWSERVDAMRQADRTSSAYNKAEQCADCDKERAETGDETALCEAHLAQAMGA